MPIQTAEADKRLPVDENSGFADTGLLRSGDSAGPANRPQPLLSESRGMGASRAPPCESWGFTAKKYSCKIFRLEYALRRTPQLAIGGLAVNRPLAED